jgi:hypothetical protein
MLNVGEAEAILEEAEKLNPGVWIQHSRNVAVAAKLIASKNSKLDEEKAYILGLLHDIGRRKYLKGMEHVLEGYNFLMEKGYDEVARICMTHTFPSKDVYAIYGEWNCSEEDVKTVEEYINSVEYDEYDLLIQLCDSLVLPEGFTLIEKRFVGTALKSGINSLILCKWRVVLEIKKYFENKMGCSIYGLLPNVIENTFGN